MHVNRFGAEGSRPLLLLHGGGVAGWMWEPMRAHLDQERRILVPDLPGHGRSAHQTYTSHDDVLPALEKLLEHEGRPATVVGFSLGAQLAVLLAARRPDLVADVIVVSAQAVPLRAVGPTLALLGATAGLARQKWFAKLQARELFVPPEHLHDYVRTSAGISRETLLNAVGENLRFTPPDGWRDFPGSALILAGSKEKSLMKRSAAALQEARPLSEREIVDGCGHGIPLQRASWLARRIESRTR
ncbi:alpha/beta hydrolase [Microbacterium luteolum]|uniref:Alpha/beta hydrolase n=1 Tax=Microbacterium luteolum TaxID=69367 RepID=A0ABY7XNC4_MICLT|nr:alpha/beta hydrolase [Microbacterium luteolum]WDM43635.1 alpha/beta hydrolase [Microbacterium luteolum]